MTKKREQDHAQENLKAARKKTYHSPKLVKYGDFRKVTLAKGNTGNDGMGHPKSKAVGGG